MSKLLKNFRLYNVCISGERGGWGGKERRREKEREREMYIERLPDIIGVPCCSTG